MMMGVLINKQNGWDIHSKIIKYHLCIHSEYDDDSDQNNNYIGYFSKIHVFVVWKMTK